MNLSEQHQADPMGIDERFNGYTALQIACNIGQIDSVRLFLDHGANPRLRDTANPKSIYHGNTALHIALERNRLDICELILDHDPDVINIRDNGGFTALQLAAFNGNKEAVQLLLMRGANTTLKNENGWSSLHTAASKGHTDIAQLLLQHAAELEGTNDYGDTPLHHALFFRKNETAKFLIEQGADVDAVDSYGTSASFKADPEMRDYIDARMAEVRNGCGLG